VICFLTSDGSEGLNYYTMYGEVEVLVDCFPNWTIKDIKKLSSRERKHWVKRAKVIAENRQRENQKYEETISYQQTVINNLSKRARR
jgi:hypothetical protein